MASIRNGVAIVFNKIFEENNDPRTKDTFLASSAYPILVIMTSYILFCTYLGPKFMQNRKPYQLKNVLIVYNVLQVALSVYLVVGGGYYGILDKNYSIICQPLDYSDSPLALQLNKMCWLYFFAKLTELLDTVFFVLRKKNNQVTFLHIYHHTIMPIFAYWGFRYYPNGHATVFGVLNSFVHVIMYTYYLLAGMGPQYQKYLWWKKHVTTIQLVQFTLIFIHNFPHLFSSCTYPKVLNVLLCLESAIFLYLFGKFYVNSYSTPKQKKSDLNGNLTSQINGKTNMTNELKYGITNGKAKIRRD